MWPFACWHSAYQRSKALLVFGLFSETVRIMISRRLASLLACEHRQNLGRVAFHGWKTWDWTRINEFGPLEMFRWRFVRAWQIGEYKHPNSAGESRAVEKVPLPLHRSGWGLVEEIDDSVFLDLGTVYSRIQAHEKIIRWMYSITQAQRMWGNEFNILSYARVPMNELVSWPACSYLSWNYTSSGPSNSFARSFSGLMRASFPVRRAFLLQ